MKTRDIAYVAFTQEKVNLILDKLNLIMKTRYIN